MTTTTSELTGELEQGEPAGEPGAGRRRKGGGLGTYLLVRFLLIFPTIFILVTTVFFLMRTTGDPITAALGGRLPPAQLAQRIHEAGYDRPLIVQYSKDRVKDVYPAYQLGWFPDYSDADDYLTPFFLNTSTTQSFLANHYDNPAIDALVQKEATTADKAQRTQLIQQVQDQVANDLPTVPYLQGAQVAVVGKKVSGADTTLDPSFKFRYAALSKG